MHGLHIHGMTLAKCLSPPRDVQQSQLVSLIASPPLLGEETQWARPSRWPPQDRCRRQRLQIVSLVWLQSVRSSECDAMRCDCMRVCLTSGCKWNAVGRRLVPECGFGHSSLRQCSASSTREWYSVGPKTRHKLFNVQQPAVWLAVCVCCCNFYFHLQRCDFRVSFSPPAGHVNRNYTIAQQLHIMAQVFYFYVWQRDLRSYAVIQDETALQLFVQSINPFIKTSFKKLPT